MQHTTSLTHLLWDVISVFLHNVPVINDQQNTAEILQLILATYIHNTLSHYNCLLFIPQRQSALVKWCSQFSCSSQGSSSFTDTAVPSRPFLPVCFAKCHYAHKLFLQVQNYAKNGSLASRHMGRINLLIFIKRTCKFKV